MKIPELRVGTAVIHDMEVGVHVFDPTAPALDGVLGGDFIQRFRVTIDRTARQMKLEPLP